MEFVKITLNAAGIFTEINIEALPETEYMGYVYEEDEIIYIYCVKEDAAIKDAKDKLTAWVAELF